MRQLCEGKSRFPSGMKSKKGKGKGKRNGNGKSNYRGPSLRSG